MRSGWILSLLLVPCIALSAGAAPQPAAAGAGLPPEMATTPAPKSGPSGDRMADTREGGESWADAMVISTLPFTDTGATCDNADDITLPCTSSLAPDVVYRYTPAADQEITVSLCGSGYDTALGIYDANHPNLACNDDFCSLQSEIYAFEVQAGQTYYIVVDGYDTSCGSYELQVNVLQPCVVECPEGAQIEGEPPCVDGYYDSYNGGCSASGWTVIEPQDGDCSVMCSRSCTFLYNGNSYRDGDWYEVTAAGGPLTMTGRAEFPLQLILIYSVTDCAEFEYVSGTGAPCEPVTLSRSFEAGEECWLWAAPAVFNGVPESDYTLDVCGIAPKPVGACCLPSGHCALRSEWMCQWYTWLGPGTDCDPDPCGADPAAACCLAGGTCEMLTAGDCARAQGVWQGAGFDCDPNPCAATPAERTTWGRIKNAYRK